MTSHVVDTVRVAWTCDQSLATLISIYRCYGGNLSCNQCSLIATFPTSAVVVAVGGGVLIARQTGASEVGVLTRTLHIVDAGGPSRGQHTVPMTGTVVVRNGVHTYLTAVAIVHQTLVNICSELSIVTCMCGGDAPTYQCISLTRLRRGSRNEGPTQDCSPRWCLLYQCTSNLP